NTAHTEIINSNNTLASKITNNTSNSDNTSEQTVLQNKDAPASDISNNVSNSDEPNNVSASDISDRGRAPLLCNNALNSGVCREETKSRVSDIPLTRCSASPIYAKPVSLEDKEVDEFLDLTYKEKKLRDRGLIQKMPSSENPATEISVLQKDTINCQEVICVPKQNAHMIKKLDLPETEVSIPAKVDVLTKSQVTNTPPKLYPLKKMLSKEKRKEFINKLTMHFTNSPKVDLYCSVDKE
ncbi:25577_t:CDS:2, partial [Gigaspora margarita]